MPVLDLLAAIKAKARELGFDVCGIAPAADHPELQFFAEWLARGYAGDDGVSRALGRAPRRRRGACCRPRSRSSSPPPSTTPTGRTRSSAPIRRARTIARYAWGDDYHDVIGAAAGRAARVDARAHPRAVRGARLRRHRPGAGARLRAARRHRLDRQEHAASSTRSSARGSSSPRSSAACRSSPMRRRSISAAPARCASRRARRRRWSRRRARLRRAASRT